MLRLLIWFAAYFSQLVTIMSIIQSRVFSSCYVIKRPFPVWRVSIYSMEPQFFDK